MNLVENMSKGMRRLKNEYKLSEDSKEFLENLRVYLFSSGKNSEEIEEIEEIVEELQVHLSEAEKSGKPMEKIIGNSPKEYMEMISDEMVIDYRSWIKYIFLIIFGSFFLQFFQICWKEPFLIPF